MIYAEIEIKEWGEEPRYRTIGPFHGTEEEICANLEERGDVVMRTWEGMTCPKCHSADVRKATVYWQCLSCGNDWLGR